MLSEFLKKNIESQADYIKANGYGYGQKQILMYQKMANSQNIIMLMVLLILKVLASGYSFLMKLSFTAIIRLMLSSLC